MKSNGLNEINTYEILGNAREVIENGKDIRLNDEELDWLQEHAFALYVAYNRAIEIQDTQHEQGEDINER